MYRQEDLFLKLQSSSAAAAKARAASGVRVCMHESPRTRAHASVIHDVIFSPKLQDRILTGSR